jgi:hypothetical protein
MAKRKGTEGQATKWPKKKDRKTSNTMTKRKGTEGHYVACPVPFFGHCVACPSVPFRLAIVLLVLLSFSFGHCVVCPSVLFYQKKGDRRTSNTMVKRK